VAAAIGIHQLARAEQMRRAREAIALEYRDRLADVEEIELPPIDSDRIHAWHLFPVRLRLEHLTIDRDRYIEELRERGVASSVHWRPLHLHPYYEESFGWQPADLPAATREWRRLISLPLFSAMSPEEVSAVVNAVREICTARARAAVPMSGSARP
jgi:perosamine synthetase